MDEPTVRMTGRARRSRHRGPKDLPVVNVRVDDHPDGPAHLSFASPDGERWKAYAYWSTEPASAPPVQVIFTEDGPEVVG